MYGLVDLNVYLGLTPASVKQHSRRLNASVIGCILASQDAAKDLNGLLGVLPRL